MNNISRKDVSRQPLTVTLNSELTREIQILHVLILQHGVPEGSQVDVGVSSGEVFCPDCGGVYLYHSL